MKGVSTLAAVLSMLVVSSAVDTKCGECVAMIEPFIDTYITGMTAEEFANAWNDACDTLPGKQKNKCLALNIQTSADVFAVLTDKLSGDEGPAKVCNKLELCKAGDKMHLDYTWDCGDCKSQAKNYQKSLTKMSESQLKKKLNKVMCTGIDASKMASCENFVKETTPLLVAVMKKIDLSKSFCSNVGVCPSIFQISHEELSSADTSAQCKKCTASVNLMRSLLDLTDAAFDSSMVCKMLPFIGDKCDDFLRKYGDTIYNGIKANLDTTEICETDLGLCKPDSTAEVSELHNTFNEVTNKIEDIDTRMYNPKARFYYKLIHLD